MTGVVSILLTAASLVWAANGCVTVDGDRIRARDLAPANPAFASLPPESRLAYSPAPGTRRVLKAATLRRMLRTHELPVDTPVNDVCLERAVEVLTPERLVSAMRAILAESEVTLELVDFLRRPLPRGRLEFPLAGLSSPGASGSDGSVLWRGRVRYGERHSAPVWARVRVSVLRRQVIAVRDLPPGKPIAGDDVEERVLPTFPGDDRPLDRVELALGSLPRRRLRAGQAVLASWLRPPNDVEQGELVAVTVRSGATRLQFEGRAETAGRLGDSIRIRNTTSGEWFIAEVVGRGKVLVQVGETPKTL